MNKLSGLKYCIPLTNSKRALWKFFFIFRYLFPKLANDLEIVISYIGITLQKLTIKNS